MNDNEDIPETVRRLQVIADGYGKGEVALTLENEPRLYRLPRCKTAGLIHHNPDKAELLLDTEGDHRLLIELDSKTIESLHHLLYQRP
jgi:hypothetical protein